MNAFIKASVVRMIRTICQTAVAMISTAVLLSDVDWILVVSASMLAGILSILTSIATGLPEVEWEHQKYMDIEPPEDAEVNEDDD